MATFTVTASNGGPGATTGMVCKLLAVSGQAPVQAGATASAVGAVSATATPVATGSWVYGAILAIGGTYTPLAGTTIENSSNFGGLVAGSVRSTSTTTAGSPQTTGATTSGTPVGAAIAEITPAAGATLAEFIGSPAATVSATGSVTSGLITPPAGSVLVLTVFSNGIAGVVTVSVTDTSGLGLSWTELAKSNASGNGYAGVWIAHLPDTIPTTLFGLTGGDTLATDTTGYTMGMQFSLSRPAVLTGIWFFSSNNGVLPAGCAIFQVSNTSIVTGTRNDAPSWSGAGGSGWVKCSYSNGVILAPSTSYKVVIEKQSGVNVYSATSHYWDGTGFGANGLTSGIINAPNNTYGDSGQDTFNTGSPWPTYPASSFGASNYWVDVEVQILPPGPVPLPSAGRTEVISRVTGRAVRK